MRDDKMRGGPGRPASRELRRLLGFAKRAGIGRRVASVVLTVVLSLSTLLSSVAPVVAYADEAPSTVTLSQPLEGGGSVRSASEGAAEGVLRAGPSESAGTMRAVGDYSQVDDTYFFNTGYYLNSLDHDQDPPFTLSDFKTSGGRVVRTTKAYDQHDYDNGWTGQVYSECQIWPQLLGKGPLEGEEGWAFITDETWEDARGAWVEMTYTEAGTLHNAANTDADDDGTLVDIKVRYTISDEASSGHLQTYIWAGHSDFDGHLAIHFDDNFSHGTFQFGILDMTVTYEFFDHATGEPIQLDSIYYTKTSMNKGETLAVRPDQIVAGTDDPGIFVSNSARPTSDPMIPAAYKFDVIDGTRLYDSAHHSLLDDYVAFAGAPNVYQVDGVYDFVDEIGHPSYYWRSVCMRLNMDNGSQLTVDHAAVGWDDWTNSFDIPDPIRWDNGGMMYTTHNFNVFTNPLPNEPRKTINGGTDLVTGVRIGDTVHYEVAQDVIDLGHDGLVKYQDFSFVDELPEYVRYVDGSAKVTDPLGRDVTDSAGTVSYEEGSNVLKYTFSEGYLADDMVYNGGDYTLAIDVEVVDQPADDLLTVDNMCQVVINGYVSNSNVVSYEPVKPVLDIEKHAVLDYNLASSINEYEYLNHDENEDFSTVHYEGYMQNVTDGTRAKNVTIYDELAPGLTLVPGSVKVTGVDGIEVTESPDGKGWTATLPDLYPWTQVSFSYDCHTTTEGNGLEVVNTAKTWCTNSELGTEGAEDNHAADDGEIYVNDPNLVVKKSVSESPIQNDDYQRGEEYRVGDTFTYSVTLVNDVPGTFAKNVRLTDDDIPEGFELVGGIDVDGLDVNGVGYKIPYPISGESDSIHGEEETRTIEWQLTDVKKDNGSWGWNLDINYLDYNRAVTVTWTVRATEDMNGYEVYNRARATADNQPNDVFWSTDNRTGSDYTIVWVNTPEFVMDKSVRKTDQAYQIGDVAAYDIEVKGLRTPGTLARQTTLEDEFLQEGTTIVENSFVITDKPTEDEPQDISGQVELNRFVGKQGWHVDMTQVYGDDTGYWVSSEDWRPVYRDGVDGVVDGEHNPVQVKPEYDEEDCESDDVNYGHDYFKVHYEATINDMALQNEIIHNEATVDSIEGFPVTDDAEVTAIGAQLMINKDSNDGGGFSVGDVAEYEITVTNNATGTVAENVQIKDGFTTAKPGTVSIVEGSIELYDNQNQRLLIAPSQITYTRNESGNIFGFAIDTGYDLPSNQKLTVRYDVKYLANNGGQVITNVAYTWADNAPEVNDPYETWPDDMDQSDLRLDKGSDKQEYDGGDYGTYTLNIVNNSDETALNVTVNDDITLDSIGIAQVVQGSIKLYDQLGNAISWDRIVYHYANGGQIKGFTVYTDYDLDPDTSMQVVYQVRFDEASQDTTVHNEAWASADNTGKATDDNDVTLGPGGGTPEDPDPEPTPEPEPGDGSLAIAKSSNKQWYVPGEQARYSLRVINPAEGTVAKSVRVTDQLDADARTVATIVEGSVKVVDATGVAVPVESISYDKDNAGRTYGFDIATAYDLVSGGALNVTYDVVFDGEINGETRVHNVAAATSDNTPGAEADHTVNLDTEAKAELRLEKTADKKSVVPGDELAYTVKVWQPAEGMTAENVVVTDTLPDGFTLDQSSVKVERDGHAQTADAEFPAGKIRVSLGDVAYGEEWTITYSGTVDEDFLGDELTNVVRGEAGNVPEDPEDTVTTPVTDPRLEIVKTADRETFAPGEDLTWQITVTQVNKGSVATGVIVTDTLPDGFAAESGEVSVTDAQGNPRKATTSIVCGKLTVVLGDLDYNDPVTITVPGTVDEDFADDVIENTAKAESTSTDPVRDTAEVPQTAEPEIDTAITKSVDRTTAHVGDTLNYVVRITTATDLAAARLSDSGLPEGVEIDLGSLTAKVGDREIGAKPKASGTGYELELGDLKAGDEVVVSYSAKVTEEDLVGKTATNVATLTSEDLAEPLKASASVRIVDDMVPSAPTSDTPSRGTESMPNTGQGPLGALLVMAGVLAALAAAGTYVLRRRRALEE